MRTIKDIPDNVLKAMVNVHVARANWQTVNTADTESKTEELNDHEYFEEETCKRITDPIADFLMSEQDFEKYIERVYARNCAKGFDSGSAGTTFWHIQKPVYDAEDALIDVIGAELPEHYTPDMIKTVKSSPKYRKEFLSIICQETDYTRRSRK